MRTAYCWLRNNQSGAFIFFKPSPSTVKRYTFYQSLYCHDRSDPNRFSMEPLHLRPSTYRVHRWDAAIRIAVLAACVAAVGCLSWTTATGPHAKDHHVWDWQEEPVGAKCERSILIVVISRRLSRRWKLCRRVQPYEAEITNFQHSPLGIEPPMAPIGPNWSYSKLPFHLSRRFFWSYKLRFSSVKGVSFEAFKLLRHLTDQSYIKLSSSPIIWRDFLALEFW